MNMAGEPKAKLGTLCSANQAPVKPSRSAACTSASIPSYQST